MNTSKPLNSRAPGLLLPVLMFTAMVMSIIGTLGALLVPTIAEDQGVSLEAAQWMLTVTLLVGSIAAPITGRIGDGPHRRKAIVITLAAVFAGAALSALSVNFAMLIAGRALQGAGLGLVPLTISVARDEIPRDKLRGAIGLLSITTAAGAGLGYPVTGVIAEHASYRAAFWMAAIASAIALVLVLAFVPNTGRKQGHRLDGIGAFLLSGSLVTLLLALSQGNSWGWSSRTIIGLLIASVIFMALWIRQELRIDHPLVDLRLMANRSVMTADVVALLMGVSLYANSSLVNRYVQAPEGAGYGFNASLVATSLMLMPLSFGSLAANRISTWLSNRITGGQMVAIGSLLVGVDMLILALSRSSKWEIFLAVGILGLGIGITFAAMPAMIVSAVPVHETGSATSMNSVLRTIGGSIGSAASITLLSMYTPAGNALPTNEGYTVTFLAGAAMCVAAAVISLAMAPRSPQTTVVAETPVSPAASGSTRTAHVA